MAKKSYLIHYSKEFETVNPFGRDFFVGVLQRVVELSGRLVYEDPVVNLVFKNG